MAAQITKPDRPVSFRKSFFNVLHRNGTGKVQNSGFSSSTILAE
ncbi:hypothetical protein [Bacillus marinisedimentorum]|nr:hypothetical protein [Bacillus marinisedimentorum]